MQGPRIKHVCRHAAVALGQARAMVPEDVPRLSALPLRDRQDIATEGRGGCVVGRFDSCVKFGGEQMHQEPRRVGAELDAWGRWQVGWSAGS